MIESFKDKLPPMRSLLVLSLILLPVAGCHWIFPYEAGPRLDAKQSKDHVLGPDGCLPAVAPLSTMGPGTKDERNRP
jgi:hypothetical protein